MKYLSLIVCVGVIAFSACTKDEEEPTPPPSTQIEDLTFSHQTSEDAITVMIVQSEQNEEVSWYSMNIGKPGEDLEPISTYQDLNNDTLTFVFNGLESATTYIVQIDGKTYAVGGEVLARGTKEIATD